MEQIASHFDFRASGNGKFFNSVTVDWLRVSFSAKSWEWAAALFDVSIDPDDWAKINKYRKKFGYSPMDGVLVATDMKPVVTRNKPANGGIDDSLKLPYSVVKGDYSIEGRFIVDFTGNGLGVYFEKYPFQTVADLINQCLLQDGSSILRIDIAFDDHNRLLNIYKMTEFLQEPADTSRVITRWRTWELLSSGEVFGGVGGLTLYIGRRGSSSFARVYDKRLQEIGRGAVPSALPPSWVRFELELKSKKAHVVCLAANACDFDVTYFFGLLRGLIDFKEGERGNKKKANMRADRNWSKFLNDAASLSVRVPKPIASIERTDEWLKTAVSASLAMMLEYHGGDTSYIERLCIMGSKKMSIKQKGLLANLDHGV